MKFQKNEMSYVLAGLWIVHETAMAAGAHVDYDDESTQMDGEFYEKFLAPLPQILGIRTSDWAFEKAPIWFALSERLVSCINSFCPEILSEVRFRDNDKYRSLIERVEKEFSLKSEEPLNPHNPEKVAQRAFSEIRQTKRDVSSLPNIVRGLALIGWVSKNVGDHRKCSFCPAQTDREIGGKYCHRHNQRNRNGAERTASKLYMQYRMGKNAKRLADQLGIYPPSEEKTVLSEPSRLRTMIRILLPNKIPDDWDKKELEKVHRLLLQFCPRVLKTLGGAAVLELGYRELAESVKEKLNPYRFNADFLQFHVYAFEVWFSLEDKVKPDVRGEGKKTQARILKARELALAGSRQVDIAKIMGVGESTVSSWAKKYKIFES